MALINKLKAIADAIRDKTGKSESLSLDEMPWEIASIISGGGGGSGLPTGIAKIDFGTVTLDSDMAGSSSIATNIKTVQHNLGVVPDLILLYSPRNVAQTYSMLGMAWGLPWRGSSYPTDVWYHANSTSTVSGTSCASTYGIVQPTAYIFNFKTYSNSSSYYWRAGTYNWICIKYS